MASFNDYIKQLNDQINKAVEYVKHMRTDQQAALISAIVGLLLIIISLLLW